jgi:hypothetical protein
MVAFTSDQWVIIALIFILGLLIGAFLTAGGRRKWKARYREEAARREAIEREHRDHMKRHDAPVAATSRRGSTRHDSDADGVPDSADRRPVDDRRA